ERDRVVPVIQAVKAALPGVTVSIDTVKPLVAEAALRAGATMLNVVEGLEAPLEILSLAASLNVPIVLMHMRGTPESTFERSRYSDVVAEVRADLESASARAQGHGVQRSQIILDPGLGFGKTPEESRLLLLHLGQLVGLGHPVLVGASRKSFLGA